jgi:hypothetical protein
MSGHAAHVGAAALVGVASERLRSSSPGRYPSGWRPRLRESFALVEALEAGEIAGAALDVYEREPEVPANALNPEALRGR